MSTNHTTNYNLCQWLATDQVQRTDFNADNAKIDAALADLENNKAALTDLEPLESSIQQITADLTKLTFGTYSGDDAVSRTINLGFTPTAVLLFDSYGRTMTSSGTAYYFGGLAIGNHSVVNPSSDMVLQIVANGFMVYCSEKVRSNDANFTYHYIAFQ